MSGTGGVEDMDRSGAPSRFETVIIGGGQAGLAVGHHLARRDRSFVILDANERVGDAWRNRWDSLRLFTPARVSGLPGVPFPGPRSSFPTKDEMADYLEAYVSRFDLPVRNGVRVDRLVKKAGRFIVMSGERRLEADNVVVATGAFQTPRIPPFAGALDPGIVQMHSSEYRRPAQLQEGAVLVVGAGNSGAEIALEVSRTHRTWLSGKHPGSEPTRPGTVADRLLTPAMWFTASHLLHVNTPLGRKLRPTFLTMAAPLARVKPKDLDAAGVERLPRTVGVREGAPTVEDGPIVAVANVIWCTGFRPAFGWIELPAFDADGNPVHERGIVRSQPGLYFVGLFFLASLTSSLVGGVGRDAEHIAAYIASRHPATRRPIAAGTARA